MSEDEDLFKIRTQLRECNDYNEIEKIEAQLHNMLKDFNIPKYNECGCKYDIPDTRKHKHLMPIVDTIKYARERWLKVRFPRKKKNLFTI